MWTINRPTIPCDWLDFDPEHVLHEYDGPMLFTTLAADGKLFLAFFCDRDRAGVRFLAVPFDEERERRLATGKINLRDALTSPRMFVFDLDQQWTPIRCWQVSPDELPARLLPKPGVMLWHDLQPRMSQGVNRPSSEGTDIKLPSTRHIDFSGVR